MPEFEDFWNFEDEDTYNGRQQLAEQPAQPSMQMPMPAAQAQPQRPGFQLSNPLDSLGGGGEDILSALGNMAGAAISNSPPGLMARGAWAGFQSAPVQAAMDYMGRPAEATRTGLIDLSENMRPEDFFSGLSRGWQGEGESFLDVYHRRGIQGPLTDAIAIGGDLALDPLNLLGLGSGVMRSLRLGSLAGRRGEAAGALISGGLDYDRVRAAIENPTQSAKVLQRLAETPDIGELARFADLISPGILAGAGDAADIARSRLAHIYVISQIPDVEEKLRAGMGYMRRHNVSSDEISRIVTDNMDALRSEFTQARLTLPSEFRKRWTLPALEKPLPLMREGLVEGVSRRPEHVTGWQASLDALEPNPSGTRPFEPRRPPGIPSETLPEAPTDYLDPTKSLEDILVNRMIQVRSAIADMKLFTAVLPYAEYEAPVAGTIGHYTEAVEGAVKSGLFSGLKFSAEDIKVLRELVPKEADYVPSIPERVGAAVEQLARGAEVPAGGQRTMALGLDSAWGGLQGMFQLARHPDDWLKGLVGSMKSAVDPRYWYDVAGTPEGQYILEHSPGAIWEGIQSGIKPEFFSSNAVLKIPILGPMYDRAGTMYTTWGNLARFYWIRGELKGAEKADMVPQMVDYINHATGVINTAGMGVSARQRAIEGGMLLLAPRYLRSVLAVGGDLLNSGSFVEAAKTLSSMFIAGTYAYTRVSVAAGQEPIYDLRDSRAYTVDIAGQRVGIGSAIRAIATLNARIATDPESLATGWKTNPIFQFWDPRLPLVPSTVRDIAMHEDFRHNKIGGNDNWIADVFDFVKVVGEKFVPTAVDGFLVERGDGIQKAVGFVASVFGARSNPETVGDARDTVAREIFQKDYMSLGPVEKRKVDNDERTKLGDLPSGPSFERQRQVRFAHDNYKRDTETVAMAYYARPPQETGASLRKRIGTFAERRNNSLEDIDRNLPEARKGPALTEAIAEDRRQQKVFKNYIRLLHEENVISGFVDRAAAEDYKNTRPQADQDYIDQRFLAAAEGLGPSGKKAVLEIRRAHDTLAPYWNLRQDIMEQYGVWKTYIDMDPYQQKQYEDSRQYKQLEQRWARNREIMRRREPDVDKALVRFYGAKPRPGRQYEEGE